MATLDLYVDNEDSTGAWQTVGSPPYISSQNEPTDYIWDDDRNNVSGVYSFETTAQTGTINSVYLHLYVYGVAASDFNAFVSGQDAGNAAVAGAWQWRTAIDVSSILTSWAQINAATVYFDRPNTTNAAGVDCAFLRVDYSEADIEIDVSDTVTSSDVLGRSLPLPGVSRSDTITIDELIKLFESIAPNLFDSITIEDLANAVIAIQANVSDTVTIDDFVDVDKEQLDLDFSVSDTITLSDILSMYLSMSASLSDTVAIEDIVSLVLKLPGISKFDVISIVDEAQAQVSGVSNISISKEDAITIVENVVGRISVSFASSDVIEVAEQILIRMLISANVSDSVLISEFVGLILLTTPITKSVSDTVSIVEQVLARILLNPFVSDAVSLVESAIAMMNLPGLSLVDVISISDSVAASITVPNKGILTGRVVLRVPKMQFSASIE
jgi:hypothetical protein